MRSKEKEKRVLLRLLLQLKLLILPYVSKPE